MINERVRSAILSLSTMSASARKIAERLKTDSGLNFVATASSDDVEALKKQIDELNDEIQELRNFVANYDDEEEIELTEDQKSHFNDQFMLSLVDQPFVVPLQVYDEEYLSAYPRSTRALICTALVNWCTSRKFEPAQLWYNVMVNNGSM